MKAKLFSFLFFVFASVIMGSHSIEKTWNATEYKKHSHSQLIAADHALRRVQLYGNKQVLDIGCGDGKITAQIADILSSGRVVGIDFSANMISLAQKSFSGKTNLSFTQMDAQ